MVQPSKKDLRKSVKGKTKAEAVPVEAVSPEIEEEDESEWSDEDEDEENGGVSEKGMKRLMELVGEEDLDEYEAGLLAAQDDEEDEDEDEEEDDEDEDEDMEGLEEESDEEVCAIFRHT
jgi:rRNA-processing protein EBP2